MANRPGPIISGHTADPGIEQFPETVAPMGTSGSDGPLIMRNVFAKFDFDFGGMFDYNYNYFRDFLAYQASHWCSFRYSIISSVHLNISTNAWVEWDTLNNIIAITPSATPRIEFTITPDMTLSIFNEFVMNTPEIDFSETELYSNRLGLLFSWNFLPKSWFYLAINDYHEQDEQGSLQPLYRIGAIKAKYLLYF